MAKTAEYSKRQEGDATVFDVIPATPPKFVAAIGAGAVGVLFGLAGMGTVKGMAILILGLGAYAIWYGLKRDIRPNGYKEKASFRVTPTAIHVNGRTFNKDDIHRLLIRNGISDEEIEVNAVRRDVPAAAVSGMVYRARVGMIANALTLETGGKSTILAGGMDETTAYGLLTDVSRIIGFK